MHGPAGRPINGGEGELDDDDDEVDVITTRSISSSCQPAIRRRGEKRLDGDHEAKFGRPIKARAEGLKAFFVQTK